MGVKRTWLHTCLVFWGALEIRILLLALLGTTRPSIILSDSTETPTDTPDCKEFLEALCLWAQRLLPTTLPDSAGTLADTCGCRGPTKPRGKAGKGRFFDLSIFWDRLSLLLYSTVFWINYLGAIVDCTLMSRIRLQESWYVYEQEGSMSNFPISNLNLDL